MVERVPKYRKIKTPADLQKFMTSMLNRLANGEEVASVNAGKLSACANSWLGAYKQKEESNKVEKLIKELKELKEQLKADGYGGKN